MFTGIIDNQAQVLAISRAETDLKIRVSTSYPDLQLGESIAVNGVCLTVAELYGEGEASFYLSSETLSKSNLDAVNVNSVLNLERALTLQTRLSGHIVQGHVDGTASLIQTTPISDSYEMSFDLSKELSRYCVEKGSVTLNGISLTINSIRDLDSSCIICIRVIPHTWFHTNLSRLNLGDRVNIEVDILAKYVERLCRR